MGGTLQSVIAGMKTDVRDTKKMKYTIIVCKIATKQLIPDWKPLNSHNAFSSCYL